MKNWFFFSSSCRVLSSRLVPWEFKLLSVTEYIKFKQHSGAFVKFVFSTCYLTPPNFGLDPGRWKNLKRCKISCEKCLFFTASFVHNFAVKCCKCGELFIFTAFNGILTNNPLADRDSKIAPNACLQLPIPLLHLSLTSMIFLLNLKQVQ